MGFIAGGLALSNIIDGTSIILDSNGLISTAAAMVKCKTADEIVNNSSVLQDDNHLFFACAANTTYALELIMYIDAKASSDFKFAFSVPAGATIISKSFPGALNTAVADATIEDPTTIAAPLVLLLRYNLILSVGANAGTCQLQWAQNNAAVEDTTMKIGSTLSYKEIV